MPDIIHADFNPSTILLHGIDQSTVEHAGGTKLTLNGHFMEGPAEVEILEGALAKPCYSGVSGQGYRPIPTPSYLTLVTPPLELGGPYAVQVTQGAVTVQLPLAVYAVAAQWRTKVHSLRRILPPWYNVGARTLESVALLEQPEIPGEEEDFMLADLSAQVTGSATLFTTPVPFKTGQLRVSLDGVLQNFVIGSPTRVTEVNNLLGTFSLSTPPALGQRLVADFNPL